MIIRAMPSQIVPELNILPRVSSTTDRDENETAPILFMPFASMVFPSGPARTMMRIMSCVLSRSCLWRE